MKSPRRHHRTVSGPVFTRRNNSERQHLLRSHSHDEYEPEDEAPAAAPVAGGTVLGVHNLAIVMPQLIVCLLDLPTDQLCR